MKSSSMVQLGFWSEPVRSVVRTLMRFRRWNESKDDEALLGSGGVFNTSITYEAWLRWYTPLCERGQQ